MQKFQVGLIAMLICCVAFVSCEAPQRMMAPEKPTGETMPVESGSMLPDVTQEVPGDKTDGEPGKDVPEDMVLIPAGKFQMGSIDADADGDEKPVHTVDVDAFLHGYTRGDECRV